jgi:hypothetical protein
MQVLLIASYTSLDRGKRGSQVRESMNKSAIQGGERTDGRDGSTCSNYVMFAVSFTVLAPCPPNLAHRKNGHRVLCDFHLYCVYVGAVGDPEA